MKQNCWKVLNDLVPTPSFLPSSDFRSYTTENTSSNICTHRLLRLGKAAGSADPTLPFPGGAVAWETPPVLLAFGAAGDVKTPQWQGLRKGTVIILSGQGCAQTPESHSLFFVVTFINPGNLAGLGLFFLEQLRCRGELCCSLRIYVTAFGKPPFPSRHRGQSTAHTQICDLGPFPEQQFSKGCPSHPGQIWHLKAVLNELQ